MSIILIKKVIKKSIFQSIKSCNYDLNINEKDIKLDETKNKDIGDISTGISFILSKKNFSSRAILKFKFFIWIISLLNFNNLGRGIIGINFLSFSSEYTIFSIGFSNSSELILHSILRSF